MCVLFKSHSLSLSLYLVHFFFLCFSFGPFFFSILFINNNNFERIKCSSRFFFLFKPLREHNILACASGQHLLQVILKLVTHYVAFTLTKSGIYHTAAAATITAVDSSFFFFFISSNLNRHTLELLLSTFSSIEGNSSSSINTKQTFSSLCS